MIKLLDCTLRDGGYITNWEFGKENITRIINDLTDSNFDMVEIGYLNRNAVDSERSFFKSINDANKFLPKKKKTAIYLAMVDIGRFLLEDITEYQECGIDGIRVAFYKHQIEDAMQMCRKVVSAGYKLFVQPMVTAEYTEKELSMLIDKVTEFKPFAVSIVDSFGYMTKNDIKYYFDILDSKLDKDCMIGFHAHNNMQLSMLNAQSLFDYNTDRTVIIDSTIYGMGRTAGNLNSELIAKYYNENIENKYDINKVLGLINDIIYPIYQKTPWGYSPYTFLTASYHCHPNYATYILSENKVSLNEFEEFLKTITDEYRVRCTMDKSLELFAKFKLTRQLK